MQQQQQQQKQQEPSSYIRPIPIRKGCAWSIHSFKAVSPIWNAEHPEFPLTATGHVAAGGFSQKLVTGSKGDPLNGSEYVRSTSTASTTNPIAPCVSSAGGQVKWCLRKCL